MKKNPRLQFQAILVLMAASILFIAPRVFAADGSSGTAQLQYDNSPEKKPQMTDIIRNADGNISWMTAIEAEDYCGLLVPHFSGVPTLLQLLQAINPKGVLEYSKAAQAAFADDCDDATSCREATRLIKNEDRKNLKAGYHKILPSNGDEDAFFYNSNLNTYQAENSGIHGSEDPSSLALITRDTTKNNASGAGEFSAILISLRDGHLFTEKGNVNRPASQPRGAVRCLIQPTKPYPSPVAP